MERASGSEPAVAGHAARLSAYNALRAARAAVDDILTVATAASTHWVQDLEAAIDGLEQALEVHRGLADSPGGTLDAAVERKPELSGTARVLRAEHVQLFEDVERVRSLLRAEPIDREKVRWHVGALQDFVRRHMGRGNDLLEDAFGSD